MSTHARNPAVPQTPWQIEPGQRLTRPQIHALYGGRPHPRISPCKSISTNILLFSEPEPYPGCFNGWDDNNRFHFHGEGTEGDQEFRQGNLVIRDHVADGDRPLRLFVPVQGAEEWEYIDRFRLDTTTAGISPGVLITEGPDKHRNVRCILVFLLVRDPEPATVILGETETAWIVKCERITCSRKMLSPKRTGHPADYYAFDSASTDITWVQHPYPHKRWCFEHPPPQAQRILDAQNPPG